MNRLNSLQSGQIKSILFIFLLHGLYREAVNKIYSLRSNQYVLVMKT